jgi:hypothetical protein
MAKLQHIVTDNTADGRRLLRFSAIIVNVGVGPFELRSRRTDTNSSWTSRQVIYNDAGGLRTVDTPSVQLVYGGDGHNHWHVKDLEKYRLVPLDNTSGERIGQKAAFCFFDNYQYKLALPGAPQAAVYRRWGCGTRGSLRLKTGLSVGWGDNYQWSLPDQYIETSGLPNGTYRLWATADQATKEKAGCWTRRGAFAHVRHGPNIQLLPYPLVTSSRKATRPTTLLVGHDLFGGWFFDSPEFFHSFDLPAF